MHKFIRELIVLVAIGISTVALSKDKRDRIVVIDSGIDLTVVPKEIMCAGESLDFTGTTLQDAVGHGTNVVGIISKKMDVKKQCIVMLKFFHTWEKPYGNRNGHDVYTYSIRHAQHLKPKIVNMSLAGRAFNYEEYNVIGQMLDSGIKVVVAAGNDGLDLSEGCDIFPACYYFNVRNFFVVGSKSPHSNKKGPVNVIRDGVSQCGFQVCRTGTSQAAANFTADLVTRK